MADRVKEYVDNLFSEIDDRSILNELKEEIRLNLQNRMDYFIEDGYEEEEAFNKSLSDLGDIGQLIEGLKRATEEDSEDLYRKRLFGRNYVIGFMLISNVILFGIMASAITYSGARNLLNIMRIPAIFLVLLFGALVYMGLIQETVYSRGMKRGRAIGYSFTIIGLISGLILSAYSYLSQGGPYRVLGHFIVFVIPSALAYRYLVQTEKDKIKLNWLDKSWQKRLARYHLDSKIRIIYRNIVGILWTVAVGTIPLVGFKSGWIYVWIPFVIAIAIQAAIKVTFDLKKR